MDIVHAKGIPMRKIFAVWGIPPNPITNGMELYTSPFNPQQRAMLVIDPRTNTWFDPVTERQGDTVQLVCAYLESQDVNYTVMDALRWLKNMVGYCPSISFESAIIADYKAADSHLMVRDKSYLSSPALLRYLEERCIPFDRARFKLKQVRVCNNLTGRHFVALGFENEDGGIAIRNPRIKAHIGKRAISFIRGKTPKPEGLCLFKDIYDYLSAILLHDGRLFQEDCIILNSYDCLQDMTGYVRNYGYEYMHSYLGNNESGETATQFLEAFCKAEGLLHKRQNEAYARFNDLNEKLIGLTTPVQRCDGHH